MWVLVEKKMIVQGDQRAGSRDGKAWVGVVERAKTFPLCYARYDHKRQQRDTLSLKAAA